MYPICFKCRQPLTHGSRQAQDAEGRWYHIGIDKTYCSSIGCPIEESILDNLRIAMKEGFEPKFSLEEVL